MATNSIRRKQRAIAVNRLTEAAAAAVDTFGIDEVTIPTFDKDAEYLVTLQIDAAASVIEAIAETFIPGNLEGIVVEFEFGAAYAAYLADERHGGDNDATAFSDALKSVFVLPEFDADGKPSIEPQSGDAPESNNPVADGSEDGQVTQEPEATETPPDEPTAQKAEKKVATKKPSAKDADA